MKLLGVFFLILSVSFTTFTQSVCPEIKLLVPPRLLSVDAEELFQIQVIGGPDKNLKYVWASVIGEVRPNGQEMKLVVPRSKQGRTTTIFVRVEGLPDTCPNSVSETVGVAELPIGEPVDQFGTESRNDVIGRIDSFSIPLNRSADYKGLIDVTFGITESRSDRITRLSNILRAFRLRNFDLRRIEFSLNEVRSPVGQTTLWVVPPEVNRKWIEEDRPGAKFIDAVDLARNPGNALPKRQCDCRWK